MVMSGSSGTHGRLTPPLANQKMASQREAKLFVPNRDGNFADDGRGQSRPLLAPNRCRANDGAAFIESAEDISGEKRCFCSRLIARIEKAPIITTKEESSDQF